MSVLKGIQAVCANQLIASPYFSTGGTVTVISENVADISDAINTALAKLGVCVIVITPTANSAFPNYLVPYFDNIAIKCRVCENVILNRSSSGTNKWASDVAEMVAVTLHQFEPLGVSECIYLTQPSITIANPGANHVGKILCYDVNFKTAGGFDYTINQVATPVIAFSGDTLTITCSTPGAGLFYTTDGSPPNPGNANALVWSAPISVTSGQLIRTTAWLAGQLTSKEAKSTAP
jgi:hypothetical protein